jgi:superfamily II DNA or RNA helicase
MLPMVSFDEGMSGATCIAAWGRLNRLGHPKVVPGLLLDAVDIIHSEGLEEPQAIPLKDDNQRLGDLERLLGGEKLTSSTFRNELLGILTPDERQGLAIGLGCDVDEVSAVVAQLKWSQNPRMIAFLSAFGVAPWGLPESQNGQLSNESIIPFCIDTNPNLASAGLDAYRYLRPYQARVYADLHRCLRPNYARCLLNMPTGTGKTRLALQYLCEYLVENPTRIIVWLVAKRELVDQAAEEFCRTWRFIGNREMGVCRWYQGRPHQEITDSSRVVFSTFNSAISRAADLETAPIGVVVVDEAHQSPAETYEAIIEKLALKNSKHQTKLLGLSATPVRGDGQNQKLVEIFYETFVQLESPVPTSNLFEWLEDEETLSCARYEQLVVEAKMDVDDAIVEKWVASGLPEDYLKELSQTLSFNKSIWNALWGKVQPGKKAGRKVLFFGASKSHSKAVCALLRFHGVAAAHVDAETDVKIRQAYVESFDRGDLQVLCNYEVFTTGFDVPSVNCVFIARPTTSDVLYLQMIGRGLRGPRMGGTALCDIVDLELNINSFKGFRAIAFDEYKSLWDHAAGAAT